jgi:diguanylate cyclase (GGDEF)-like protein
VSLTVGFLAATWVMVGLKNRLVDARRYFDATIKREIERRTRPLGRRGLDDSPLALLIIDLDDFKGVNDRYGHQVGDAVLQEATASALAVLRSSDTIARIGDDEFAIIAPGAHGEGAARMAESVRAAVAASEPGDEIPAPSASVGWAVFPDDGQDFETLMRAADDRMLAIKRSDPRRLVTFRQSVGI